MSFPLQTLLDIRRRTEEEAERSLAGAVAGRAEAEAEQRRLQACAAAAHRRAEAARAGEDARDTAGGAAQAEDFHRRLVGEARQADAAVLTHRKGALRTAREEETAARERHAAARRDRQAVEQAKERGETEQRRVAERRAEDATSDLAAGRRRGK